MSWWRDLVDRLLPRSGRTLGEEKTIRAAKQMLESQIMAVPGVVSVGIGTSGDGTEVIVVGVDGSRPDLESRLPNEASGYPVEVRRIGPLRAT
jgi:hypothetical protein